MDLQPFTSQALRTVLFKVILHNYAKYLIIGMLSCKDMEVTIYHYIKTGVSYGHFLHFHLIFFQNVVFFTKAELFL